MAAGEFVSPIFIDREAETVDPHEAVGMLGDTLEEHLHDLGESPARDSAAIILVTAAARVFSNMHPQLLEGLVRDYGEDLELAVGGLEKLTTEIRGQANDRLALTQMIVGPISE